MKIPIQTVTTAGFSMDYICFGNGAHTMVILLGLSVQSVHPQAKAIAKQYARFTDDYTVFLFDRRKELPPVYTVEDMANDTAAAFESLGLENIYLFGASQGGMMAMLIALDHPHLVKKLALGCTAARLPAAQAEVFTAWLHLAETGERKKLYECFAEAIYPPALFKKYRPVLGLLAKGVTQEDLKRFITLAEGTAAYDILERVPAIRQPVLVLGAEDDGVLGPQAAKELAAALQNNPHATCHIYEPGYGHAAYDTAPDFGERVYAFFSDK